jgi:hypothetical protein
MAAKSSAYGEKLFGLHEVKFVSMDGNTIVDLPVSQKLTFKERVISAESAGDDAIQAIQTVPIAADWELEHGGIPLPAYALVTGRTLSVDGVSPNEVATLDANLTPFPYFQIFGKSLDESLGDLHVKIFKAKLTESPEGSLEYGKFLVLSMKGTAVAGAEGFTYEFAAHETAEALDLPASGS